MSKKDDKPGSRTIFFNKIDYILRQAQDGQTIGIPVGQDSSRVISEIVAVAVDVEFLTRVGEEEHIMMIRHVDDIWIGAPTYDEAERLLYTYRSCLREFELDINELKTSIIDAPADLSSFWPMELGDLLSLEFKIYGSDRARRDQKMMVLDKAFDAARKNRDDEIIRFCLRRLDKYHTWRNNWDIMEPFLMRCAVNFPHSIDYVARAVAWRARVHDDANRPTWQAVSNDVIGLHAKLANDSEVCWMLWLAKELSLQLDQNAVTSIAARCGPFPVMLVFDCLVALGGKWGPVRREIVDRVGGKPFAGPLWILAYEAWVQNWIRRPRVWEDAPHEMFRAMRNAGVSFYDANALPPTLQGEEEGDWEQLEAIEDFGGAYEGEEDEGDVNLDF